MFQSSSLLVARKIDTILWLLLQFGGCVFPSSLAVYPQLDNSTGNSNIDLQMTVNKKEKKKAIIFYKERWKMIELQQLFFCKQHCRILSAVGTADWSRHGSAVSGLLKGNSEWHEPVNTDAKTWNFMDSTQDNFWAQNALAVVKENWGWERLLMLSFLPTFPLLLMFILGNQYIGDQHLLKTKAPEP